VYWLGNWQFACLDYYRPPKGVRNRCVKAEPFPAVLQRQVDKVEQLARRMFRGPDMPAGWHLNTCLVNFYGSRLEDGRWVDTARVGEHKDFEPGPVASLSFGERALIQFVTSSRPGERDEVVLEQWLDDGSLQLFGGARWKEQTFHRVQRVDTRGGHLLPPELPDFKTRRINLTFRYVPDEHVTPFALLSPEAREDVRPYMATLAEGRAFFRAELERDKPAPSQG
jgi:DNA oxidative demethylase